MKENLKKILIFFKIKNFVGRLYFLIKTNGLIKGLYHFLILDLIKYLSNLIYDSYWGISTTKIIEVEDLDIKGEQKKHSTRYQATSLKHLKLSLDYLLKDDKITYDFFLDIGCGMGRPCFFASKYYPRISKFVGIDISDKMISLANKNLKSFRNKKNFPKNNIKFINQDALDFKFEDNRSYLIFLFNPFSDIYVRKFFSQNMSHIKKNKSKIIFVNQSENGIFEKYFNLIFNNSKKALRIYE